MLNKIQWSVQHSISRVAGIFCECEWRWLKNLLIRIFMRIYAVDLSQCVKTTVEEYKSLNEFFIRHLKSPPARVEGAILSPADSCISQMGPIEDEFLVQAKGKTYTLSDLLANDKEAVDSFRNGHFITFYLAPSDYHRVHMPIAGTVSQKVYVPGFLFSVGYRNTQRVSQLFTRNERVISLFDTSQGKMGMVQVGSCIVGHMGTSWEPSDKVLRRGRRIESTTYKDETYVLQQADEMGYFKLGSTVILLFGPSAIDWKDGLHVNQRVRCGDVIGYVNAP